MDGQGLHVALYRRFLGVLSIEVPLQREWVGLVMSCCCEKNSDRKNCENVLGKLEDLAYNAASFVWTPEVGAKVRENGEGRGGGVDGV